MNDSLGTAGMNIVTAIIAIMLLVVLYVIEKRRNSSDRIRQAPRRKSSAPSATKYHAVSLRIPSSACDAAKKMEGRRFLSSAAPRIPLPDCDVLDCKCRFVHHKDRRSSDDRRDPLGRGFGSDATGKFDTEQRKRHERRDDPPDDIFS